MSPRPRDHGEEKGGQWHACATEYVYNGRAGSRARGCHDADGAAQKRASKRISRTAKGRRGGARGGRVEPAQDGEARDSVATTSQRGAAQGGAGSEGEAGGAWKERAASQDGGQREGARAGERVTAEGSGRKRAASESDSEENDLEGKSDEEDSSSDSESEGEWQEVDELPAEEEVGATSSAAGIVSIGQAVQIEIETPEMAKLRARKDKRKKLFEGWVRRMANRHKKEVQLDLHKVHLLCLLANGMHRSAVCSSLALRALALSLLPTQLASSPSTNHDLAFLARLLTWFNFTFRVDEEEEEVQGGTAQGALMTEVLTARFSSRTARSAEELSHLFLVVVRALGITSRLVLSLQPLPLKAAAAEPKPKAAWKPGATSTALAPCDAWVEVLLLDEGPHGRAPVGAAVAGGRWVCVEVAGAQADRPEACVRRAARPLAYVVAFDDDGCMKDITRRYDPAWLTYTRRLRVDTEWWQAALFPFESPHTRREQQEDEQLEAGLLIRPMPSSVSEFKSHPLYALPRHLLKYEAIYPPGAAVLGTCRGEPVYARECVHTLHSCDTWLKQARVVRLGEVPYKMVKGQSNRSRKLRMADPESRDKPDLALFGPWQTEEYQPPVAVDGKVPRNDYGNVYLFRPSMLPVGCVHLHAPGLNRVARSIGVDCAPAVTGFDFHAGYSHPVTDGFVVCEEVKDTLLAAWERAQEEVEKKEREKRENRAFGNWKLLTRGLLIRERLKLRYSAHEPGSTQTTQGEEGTSQAAETPGVTPANDLAVAWPDLQERARSSVKRNQGVGQRDRQGQNSHLFPFEKL
ncbi:DNA repair protein complementing XP-C cells homolog isoform X3 [Lampetra planeri]